MQTLRGLLAAPLDPNRVECTSFPWWIIIDPRNLNRPQKSDSVIHGIGMHGVTGPFFSRESATAFLTATRYNFGKNAVVWCASGTYSRDYRELLNMARCEGMPKGCHRSHPHEPDDFCLGDLPKPSTMAFHIANAFGLSPAEIQKTMEECGYHEHVPVTFSGFSRSVEALMKEKGLEKTGDSGAIEFPLDAPKCEHCEGEGRPCNCSPAAPDTVRIGDRNYATYAGVQKAMEMEAREVVATPEAIFTTIFRTFQDRVHANAHAKGWHKEERNEGELIALEHAELSECLEALRHGNPPSEHIPEFTGAEEELADVIIRIMDHAAAKKHRVAEAIIAKMAFNTTRPHMHGDKRF